MGVYMEKKNFLDYYVAGVPAAAIFKMSYDETMMLVKSAYKSQLIYELSLIGLIAYFESFCKNNFASIINILPFLLQTFDKQREVKICVNDLFLIKNDIENQLGFIVSEQFDFGTPKLINNLYKDLIEITPFSKDDEKEYSQILSARNLLVHHAGIYTAKYYRQNISQVKLGEIFYNSLILSEDEFLKMAKFIETIAMKISNVTEGKLTNIVLESPDDFTEAQRVAIKYIGWDRI